MLIKIVTIYFIMVNSIGYFIMAVDKRKSIKDKWRIKEKTLFAVSLVGGALGMMLGMKRFHHKTRKPMFRIGIPMLTILNMAVYIYLFYKLY
ncbi:DUF1294 domain-containing protein [Lutispora thermophila]|uniref:Uncharacterized membrane protein YsdA, DUF1294 family n=1 Tax=Lutispora thermophila DSM 19022 TaxID=1122184 RepID=A0A1M6H8B8_9FIRM|nr:DUF1294 domain-containing protein [Lutispora thermophila]SHJ18424.1 Uncharacterized membrane protein YsdA, DUF1294 family [Lutispora thermophila DSM 19022]